MGPEIKEEVIALICRNIVFWLNSKTNEPLTPKNKELGKLWEQEILERSQRRQED